MSTVASTLIERIKDGPLSLHKYLQQLFMGSTVIFSAGVNTYADDKANEAEERASRAVVDTCTVCRGGRWLDVPFEEVVVGDVIRVEKGEVVPADARIVEIIGGRLTVTQTFLTGESAQIYKTSKAIGSEEGTDPRVRSNVALKESVVMAGQAVCVVTAVGESTEYGKLEMVLRAQPAQQTLLAEKTDTLADSANTVSMYCPIICFSSGTFTKPARRVTLSYSPAAESSTSCTSLAKE
jgi:magnesium-transporting ATPase (P-type)